MRSAGEQVKRDLVMMARCNELEVEDIIEAVVDRDPSVAALLESLSAELQWLEKDAAKQQRQVPFSTWSRIAATFVRSGYSGLVTTAISDRRPGSDFGFCTAFLESYKTPESVSALVEIVRTIDEWTTEARVQTATAIKLGALFQGYALCLDGTGRGLATLSPREPRRDDDGCGPSGRLVCVEGCR
jgi:hypothetical protein